MNIYNFFNKFYSYSVHLINEKLNINNNVFFIAFPIVSFLGVIIAKIYNSKEKSEIELYEKVRLKEISYSIKNLRNGYMVISFFDKDKMQSYFESSKKFFSKPLSYREQFIVKDGFEIGYASLIEKECFVIRHQQIPSELEEFVPYILQVHQLALGILLAIEEDLCLSPGELIHTVSKTALPVYEKSTSVLRLFSYLPSSKEGVVTEAHEDIGLLTIIPVSQVSALEVLDYSKSHPEWINMEQQAKAFEAIVLVGKTLSMMTGGKYLSVTHRVKKSQNRRFSIVYQLRAEPQIKIEYNNQIMTIEDWMQRQKAKAISVNRCVLQSD